MQGAVRAVRGLTVTLTPEKQGPYEVTARRRQISNGGGPSAGGIGLTRFRSTRVITQVRDKAAQVGCQKTHGDLGTPTRGTGAARGKRYQDALEEIRRDWTNEGKERIG